MIEVKRKDLNVSIPVCKRDYLFACMFCSCVYASSVHVYYSDIPFVSDNGQIQL